MESRKLFTYIVREILGKISHKTEYNDEVTDTYEDKHLYNCLDIALLWNLRSWSTWPRYKCRPLAACYRRYVRCSVAERRRSAALTLLNAALVHHMRVKENRTRHLWICGLNITFANLQNCVLVMQECQVYCSFYIWKWIHRSTTHQTLLYILFQVYL